MIFGDIGNDGPVGLELKQGPVALVRLDDPQVRRSDPGEGARYVVVSGSSAKPMTWGEQDQGAVCIVESELDGFLLNQEAGDLSAVVALGTATGKPDTRTHELLKSMPVILVALDGDDAGAKASWSYWPETYGSKVRRWPCINGKDPSEARKNGLDLHSWVAAGMFQSEDDFERSAIQTVDGGLSDREAMLALLQNERNAQEDFA